MHRPNGVPAIVVGPPPTEASISMLYSGANPVSYELRAVTTPGVELLSAIISPLCNMEIIFAAAVTALSQWLKQHSPNEYVTVFMVLGMSVAQRAPTQPL
jgi:hypothetical protein